MKHHRLLCQAMTGSIFALLIASPASALVETPQDLNAWTYRKEWDKLSNLNYSLARSPIPKRSGYDNLRLELICKNNKLQFAVEAKSLITSQGKAFDFDYQIDQSDPVSVQMKTYSDSKRRGYTDEQVERITADILSGQSVFIRIHTLISTVLSAAIPLNDAEQPIRQVLADCGVEPPSQEEVRPSYDLADFERDFKQLSSERQRQALDKIRKIMEEAR
jgi:hypothetical protein